MAVKQDQKSFLELLLLVVVIVGGILLLSNMKRGQPQVEAARDDSAAGMMQDLQQVGNESGAGELFQLGKEAESL